MTTNITYFDKNKKYNDTYNIHMFVLTSCIIINKVTKYEY